MHQDVRDVVQEGEDDGLKVEGLGFRVWGLGFRVWGLGFRIWGLRFRGSLQNIRVPTISDFRE